jgi:hypothetical protein
MNIFSNTPGVPQKIVKSKNALSDIIELRPAYDNFIIFSGVFISLFTGIIPVYANLCAVSEVYTLHLFFILLNIKLLLIWEKTAASLRSTLLLYLISFLFGLSHANHMTSALMAPVYLFFIIRKLKLKFFHPAYWLVPLLFFIAGFFPYVLTVKMSYGAISWFPIKTFADFKYLFLAESYKNSLFFNKEILVNMAGGLFGWAFVFIKTQVLLFYGFYFFIIAGIFYIFKNHRSQSILIGGGFFINLLYFSNYIPNNQDFYLPVFAFTTVFLGIFFVYFYAFFIHDLKKIFKYLSIVAFACVLAAIFTYQVNMALTPAGKLMDIGGKKTEGPNKINYTAAFDDAERIARSIPEESTVIFHGDTMAPLLYLKYCTGYDEKKHFYHSLLYHFRKYGPNSGRSWTRTLDEELIKPGLKSGKGIFVTISDNALYEDAVLYPIIRYLFERNYDLEPVYDMEGFTSLGKIHDSYISKEAPVYMDIRSLINCSTESSGEVKKPVSTDNHKINFISIQDELVIPLKTGEYHALVLLFKAKCKSDKIERIAEISIDDEDHYINNILDCRINAIGNENYFPERKMFDKQNEIYKKYFPLKKKTSGTVRFKKLNKECDFFIYGIGFEK